MCKIYLNDIFGRKIMCTAISFKTKDLYFGRTLDHHCSYGEKICISPKGFDFHFRREEDLPSRYAMLGVALEYDSYPLYYDAVNEAGLCMAGLNFPGNAHFECPENHAFGVAPFEFIPWVLSQNASVADARKKLINTVLLDIPFNDKLPPAPLHWILADKNDCVVIEQTKKGLSVYDDPMGVMTNNPPFEYHLQNLKNYLNLTPNEPKTNFSSESELEKYSLGMGAIGLPGDFSSQSRFVRCAFVKENAVSGDSEKESVSTFFHILSSVEMTRGCCRLSNGGYEHTVYTVCYNADKGICYLKNYDGEMTVLELKK